MSNQDYNDAIRFMERSVEIVKGTDLSLRDRNMVRRMTILTRRLKKRL